MTYLLDTPPTEDKMYDKDNEMSRNWESWFDTINTLLNNYLTGYIDRRTGRLTQTFQLPTLTTDERDYISTLPTPSTIATGTLIYNTTLNKVQVWDGTTWVDL